MALVSKNFGDIITFTRASTATYFDATGTLQSAAIDAPRFDYDPATLAARGFLIEEARTNSIRNNTMQGAVAGTPGTAPTNWSINLTPGVTQEIVGTGTEDGITYVDIKLSGTPSGGTNVAINFEPANQIPASSGQTWTESVFVKLQAGSFANTVTSLSLLGTNGTSGLEGYASSTITSTPSNLRECRLSVTGTFVSASITHAQPRVRVGITVGAAIDITLRIGLPQLELGAFATSVIPTTTTALTRSADVASVNTLSPWYSATEGTLYSEATFTNTVSFNTVAALGDGTGANTMRTVQWNDGTDRIFSITASNVNQASYVGTGQVGTAKFAGAYKLNDVNASKNGSIGITDTTATIPTINALWLGQTGSALFPLNGWLRRVSYFPRRLANAELQSLTS